MENVNPPKKKGRGPGKKPRMLCTSIRLPPEVIDYFNKHYPKHKQVQMRAVLVDYVADELKREGAHHGTQEGINE